MDSYRRLSKVQLTLFIPFIAACSSTMAQSRKADASETYRFGQLAINSSLSMALYGPMREIARSCSSQEIECVDGGFVALALPRSCIAFAKQDSFHVDNRAFRRLGPVKYRSAGTVQVTQLYTEQSRPDVVFGATKEGGIRFVMIAAASRSGALETLIRSHDTGGRQVAFDAAKDYILPAPEGQRMFVCGR